MIQSDIRYHYVKLENVCSKLPITCIIVESESLRM